MSAIVELSRGVFQLSRVAIHNRVASEQYSRQFAGHLGDLVRAAARLPWNLDKSCDAEPVQQLAAFPPEGYEIQLAMACTHPHPAVRYAAVSAFACGASHPAINAALVASLDDYEFEIRRKASQLLQARHRAGLFHILDLTPPISGATENTLRWIVETLDYEGAEGTVPLFAQMLGSEVPVSVRRRTIRALKATRSPGAVSQLIQAALTDAEPEVRCDALLDLDHLVDWRAHEVAVQSLAHPHKEVRKRAIHLLESLETLGYARYRDHGGEFTGTDYRTEETLDMVPPPAGEVARSLVPMLDDPDAEVRIQAINSIGFLMHRQLDPRPGLTAAETKDVYRKLGDMALGDHDEHVRNKAAHELAHLFRRSLDT